jgi:hypothetical protein
VAAEQTPHLLPVHMTAPLTRHRRACGDACQVCLLVLFVGAFEPPFFGAGVMVTSPGPRTNLSALRGSWPHDRLVVLRVEIT